MSDIDPDLRDRLARMQGNTTQGPVTTRPKPSKAKTALLAGGALVAAGLVYVYSQPQGNGDLQVRRPSEFQTEGSGFGDITPVRSEAEPQTPAPEPAPELEPVAPTVVSDNSEVVDLIRSLQDQINDLKSQPGEQPQVAVDNSGLDAMQAELDRLKEEAAERERDLQSQIEARDLQIAGLNNDMDMLRLQGGQPVGVSTGPVVSGDDALLAERAQAAADAAALEQQRITSPMVALGGGGMGEAASSVSGALGGDSAAAQDAAKLSDDAEFVRNAGQPVQVQRAEIIVNPSNTVTQGTMIQAVLETAIDSTLEGPIRGQITTDVVAYDGSRVLIPRGSKLIGSYSADVDTGQSRLLVAWERIIMPDSQSVQISSFGGDALGRSGTTGKVNNHFLKRFGAAALISTISAIPSIIEDNDDSGEGGVTISTGGTQGVSGVTDALGGATDAAIGKYINMPPTITVPQGTRITVMVDRDLEIF